MEREFLKMFDGVLCISPFLANLARAVLPRERVLLIPNGFDRNVFAARHSGKEIRKELGIKEKDNLVMYTGGLKPWADIDLLIQAMVYVIQEMPNSHLVLVGEGEAKYGLMHLCQQVGISGNVVFAGGVPHTEIPKYLAAADLLALPLRSNPFNEARFPNRIAEYMAAGKPIVTNRVGVAGDLFKDGRNAVVIDSDQPEEFARGILRILMDKEKAKRLGIQARKYAWNNLTWDKIALKVEEFYYKLL
ncbi:MAG: glycosyltransferase [Candidatus Hadarchaeales archaeon]